MVVADNDATWAMGGFCGCGQRERCRDVLKDEQGGVLKVELRDDDAQHLRRHHLASASTSMQM